MRMNRLINGVLGVVLATFIMAPTSHAQITTTQLDSKALPAIPVGLGPEGVTTDGASIFVANQFSNTVTKLRASDGTAIGTYRAGHRPVALAFDGAFIWVANYLSNNVMKLDPGGVVVGTYAVGDGPGGLLATNGNIWVANR